MNIEDVLKGHGIGASGSSVKSIQKGSVIPWNTLVTTKDIPISSIDPLKSVVIIYYSPDASNADFTFTSAEIIDNTTLRLYRSTARGSTGMSIGYTIIEFNNVKSIQKGDAVFNGIEARTIPVSNFNSNKAVLLSTQTTSSVSLGATAVIPTFECIKGIVDDNNIKLTSQYSTVKYQLIEFK